LGGEGLGVDGGPRRTSAQTCSRESSEVVGRAVEKRGCGGRLGETIAAARLPDPTSSLGGGAYLLLDRPQPTDEQGLREAHRDQRSVHLRGAEPPNGEEIGSLMRLFAQSLETVRKGFRIAARASILAPHS